MRQQVSARRVAAEVLSKIDSVGAYANIELDSRLRQTHLDGRDRALATELTYGTLRWRGSLDRAISAASSRPLHRIDCTVRNVLRMTAYQLLFLDGIPPHAALHEGVELVRQMGHVEAGSFVNAVGRSIQREGIPPVARGSDQAGILSAEWSHPEWLVRRWLQFYGLAKTETIVRANQHPAPLTLRINRLRVSAADFLAELAQQEIEARPGGVVGSVVVAGGVAVEDLPGYRNGWFVVQDESSQLVAPALSPEAGESVVDLCSAPGGKATHLAELMADQGEVVAVELHSHRARMLAQTAMRMGMQSIRVVNRDSRSLPPVWRGRYDGVLLDAPCSGTGVLRRRVDLRWRLEPEELASLTSLQDQLLQGAAKLLRADGKMIYSTCSIEPEENREMVAQFLAKNPDFESGSLEHLVRTAPELANLRTHPELEQGQLQLLPGETSNDGFFVAALRKVAGRGARV